MICDVISGKLVIVAQNCWNMVNSARPYFTNPNAFNRKDNTTVEHLSNDVINPLFDATVQSTEEAVLNAMCAAETMVGINGNKACALPVKKVMQVSKKHGRAK